MPATPGLSGIPKERNRIEATQARRLPMQLRNNQYRRTKHLGVGSTGQPWRPHYRWIFACLVALAALTCTARSGAQTSTQPVSLPPKGENQPGPGQIYPPILTNPPDKNAQLEMQQENANVKQLNYAAANAERKK